MATHNQVRIVGYILKEPAIINEGIAGEEKFVAQVRTTRRDIEDFNDDRFADLVVFYDGIELMEKMKKLKRFDVIDIKGVLNICPTPKKHVCPECGTENIKYNSLSSFIYPISISRIASYQEYYEMFDIMPNKLLVDNYKEISNQCLIIGTVVSEPEIIETRKGRICRYCLCVNRKYYIKTQDITTTDYPWVYSYGDNADRDYLHLKKNESSVLIDGFIHNVRTRGKLVCEHCGKEFVYKDIGTQFTPYSVEYLSGYKTDEELLAEKK